MAYANRRARPTVFYGICGEGLGHYSRATVLIQALLDAGYRVEIFTSRRVVALCRKKFPDCLVHNVPGMHMCYLDSRLHLPYTTWNNMKSIVHGLTRFTLITQRARRCHLIGIISDYEPLTSNTGILLRVPVIAFDHQQVITECAVNKKMASSFHRGLIRFSNTTTYPRPSARIITSFFHPPWKKKRVNHDRLLIGPVLRPHVLNHKTEQGNHILVYQTSATMASLQNILDMLPGEKRVYGASETITGHHLLSFDERRFIHDLATCRFAVVNGGYSTLCEALYFGKPIICFPFRNQAEQEINAQYIHVSGFGEWYKSDGDPALLDFSGFLRHEEQYRQQITKNRIPCGNGRLKKYVLEYLNNVQMR
ncbi:MAG: hypothetical protein CSA26_07130 [Desulfobacterales bacterium]|nr:MAG: hypothetical protein CSA26_07130 [Desulfobacterales bacterium]